MTTNNQSGGDGLLTDEVWKPVVGHEENYEVSNFGRIRNKRGVMRAHPNRGGYMRITLQKSGKKINHVVHRIVVSAFIGGDFEEVDHINGDKHDNRLCNLRPCTRRENQNFYYKRKYPGTYLRKGRNLWESNITFNGKTVSVGLYETQNEASAAYRGAAMVIDHSNKAQGVGDDEVREAIEFMKDCISTCHVDYIKYRNVLIRAAQSNPSATKVMTEELRRIIGEGIGQASLCWTPAPNGVFNSSAASKVVDEVVEAIRMSNVIQVREEK